MVQYYRTLQIIESCALTVNTTNNFSPEKVTSQTACKSASNCLVTQVSDTCLENEARIDYSTSSKYEKNYLDMYNKD